MNRVFFGHHKCASRFFRRAIFEPIASANGWPIFSYKIIVPPYHFSDLPRLDLDNIDWYGVRKAGAAVVNVLNTSPEVVSAVEACGDFRGLHVVRDPRQILISAYFHHRGTHPVAGSTGFFWDKLSEDQRRLRELPQEEGILYELDNITGQVLDNQIGTWVPDERVLDMRAEDVVRDRAGFLERLRNHLLMERLPKIDWSRRYSDSGAGHWSQYFTPRITSRFNQRYGDLLLELGYTP